MASAAAVVAPAAPPPKPAAPPLDPTAAVRLQNLKLAEDRYKKYFRMRATGFLRGKGSLAVVTDAICMGCTHCFDNCAFEAIDMVDRKFTLPELTYTSRKAAIIYENCVGCEKCAIVCPVDAITMVPKDGWESKDGRLVQVTPPPVAPRPFYQPPKPGAPRPPVSAERFVAFREEEKKAPAAPRPAAPAASPPKPAVPVTPSATVAAPAPPPRPATPPAAPSSPPAAAPPPRKPLTPEEIQKLREEAMKKAQAKKDEEAKSG